MINRLKKIFYEIKEKIHSRLYPPPSHYATYRCIYEHPEVKELEEHLAKERPYWRNDNTSYTFMATGLWCLSLKVNRLGKEYFGEDTNLDIDIKSARDGIKPYIISKQA